jgi:hypothetical protein
VLPKEDLLGLFKQLGFSSAYEFIWFCSHFSLVFSRRVAAFTVCVLCFGWLKYLRI